MAELLSIEDLPRAFTYPRAFVRAVELGLTNLEPWWIIDGDRLRARQGGIEKRYRKRNLVVFAERQDNDDVACFDLDSGAISVVHDWADRGHEQRQSYATFDHWLRAAVDDYIEFGSDEGE